MVDVCRDDGSPARHLGADELRLEPFADRDELHLLGDDAAPGILQLRDGALSAEGRRRTRMERGPVHARVRRRMRARRFDHVVPAENPGTAQRRQTVTNVGALRSARVVHAKRRLAGAERNLAHRHAEFAAFEVHLARIGQRIRRRPCGGSSQSGGRRICARGVRPLTRSGLETASRPDDSSLRSAAHSARIYTPRRGGAARNGQMTRGMSLARIATGGDFRGL